jgi:hypothetical protein
MSERGRKAHRPPPADLRPTSPCVRMSSHAGGILSNFGKAGSTRSHA